MPTWKKIALADDVGSLGTIDQTIPLSTDRTININEGSLNVVDIGNSGENYFKIAQTEITLGSGSDSNGNENAKLQCRNDVSFGAAWSNGSGGSANVLGVNRFRVTHSPLTLQNHPFGSNSQQFLKGPFFVMRSNGLGLGNNIAQQLGLTINGPSGLDQATVYGGIQWDVTTVGNNITDSSDPDFFTKFETKCTIATQKGIGSGNSDSLQGGFQVTALELTGGPDAADNGHTANEQTLSEVSFYGTELEALTRRSVLTFQCGFSEGQIMSANSGTLAQQALKTSGAVQMAASTTLTSAHGIVMPFGGFIAGGSFSAERPPADVSTAVSGNISLFVRKVFANTGTSHQDIRVASAIGNVQNKTRSDEYPINNGNHRTTGNTGVQFDAGDVLIPFFQIDPDNTDTIRLQDLIAQIFVYTEAIVA